jgi:hypothetical protein
MLRVYFCEQNGLKNMGSTININATVIPGRQLTVSRQHAVQACSTCCLLTVSKVAYLSGALFPSFYGYDCGVNNGCRPRVLQNVWPQKYTLSFGGLRIF